MAKNKETHCFPVLDKPNTGDKYIDRLQEIDMQRRIRDITLTKLCRKANVSLSACSVLMKSPADIDKIIAKLAKALEAM